MCGATSASATIEAASWGLSPRVRGNPQTSIGESVEKGPIPACAGQPYIGTGDVPLRGAYPRVCGATAFHQHRALRMLGLSPRVRGNLPWMRSAIRQIGPIPACAGQPEISLPTAPVVRAYPRVCGATQIGARLHRLLRGLSPRVRGNRPWRATEPGANGPIPACAGQPSLQALDDFLQRAYPRVCGATTQFLHQPFWRPGLSPRVRGNPRPWPFHGPLPGPIPACAGQPRIPGPAACV